MSKHDNMFGGDVNNTLEAYHTDAMVRERCNNKGLYVIFGETITVNYYLTEGIESSSEYHEYMEIALALTDNDNINFIIDNGGGYLSGAQMIITGINSTAAVCTAIITDTAASAATIIALNCDEIIMTDHSMFMVHSVSFGSGGKMHEAKASVEFILKQSRKLIEETYKYFLSNDEIEEVIKGGDLYFDADETMARWSLVKEQREKLVDEAEAEHLADHVEYLEKQLTILKSKLPVKEKPKNKPRATKA